MFHLVARSLPDRLLFSRDTEALVLWNTLARVFPELVAACLMPDHLHLILPHEDPQNRLHTVLQAYTQHRNRARGLSGPLWQPRPPPVAVPNASHLGRTIRYVHLNPCRAGLVRDPLAWPFSTHRDRAGFAARPVVPVDRDPARFHRFVSADDTCDPQGTPLPTRSFGALTLHDVVAAAASVWRTPDFAVTHRGEPRTTCVKVAWHLGVRDRDELAATTGLSRAALYAQVRSVPGRGARLRDPLEATARAVGDPRFHALSDRDERRFHAAWARYRDRD